jgi:hypothetical protein
MAILFESEWQDFSSNPDVPVEVAHNLGKCPEVIGFFGRNSQQEEGFPRQQDGEGHDIPSPRLEETTNPNRVLVFKPAAYTAATQFKIKIFG